MHTEQLKNFLTLAEALNFRKAAENTYIAQPALSRQIQNLEQEIGAKLFDRSKRQIKLTAAGRYFRAEAEGLLARLDQVNERAQLMEKGKAGIIRIAHASSAMHVLIPALLAYAKSTYPHIMVELMEGTNEFIFESLMNEEADFGFAPNAFVPEGLSGHIVYKENYVLILPKNHRLNASNFTDLGDCKHENWILHPQKEGYGYMEEILKIIGTYGYSPTIVHRSPNTSSVLRLVSAGLGISMMGKSTLKGFDLNLKSIELKKMPQKLDMKLVWKQSRKSELSAYLNIIRQFEQKNRRTLPGHTR